MRKFKVARDMLLRSFLLFCCEKTRRRLICKSYDDDDDDCGTLKLKLENNFHAICSAFSGLSRAAKEIQILKLKSFV